MCTLSHSLLSTGLLTHPKDLSRSEKHNFLQQSPCCLSLILWKNLNIGSESPRSWDCECSHPALKLPETRAVPR